MFLQTTLALLALLALPLDSAFAGQVPVVDGVLGGVPKVAKLAPVVEELTTMATTPGQLRVIENSGVCETTSGVYQASGYADLTSTKSIFFYFFAARQNPDSAPVAVWLNGGPGSSSMYGLFQENGPCRVNNASTGLNLNPYSWNNVANTLYVDQPVGAGFSHGTMEVGTSQQAATDMYTFLQIFFSDSRFKKYAPNSFALWTESYGGHYGPVFAAYFLDKNKAIANGTATGTTINLKYLGVGNGLTDPLSQYPGYIAYAASNPYHALVSSSTIASANTSWTKSGGCKAQITNCYNGGSNSVCSAAQSYCNNNILSPLIGNYDVYDVRSRDPDPYPPAIDPLFTTSFRSKIGAEVAWKGSNSQVYSNFASTGDWMRNSRPALESVINAGVRTLVFDGDADYILNYVGVEAMVSALTTKFSAAYAQQAWATYNVAGLKAGQFKQSGTFSYLRIYGAGHEVPAYGNGNLKAGQAALQFFTQIMSNSSLSST